MNAPWIDQQTVRPRPRSVNLIGQHALMVALNRTDLIVGAGRGDQFLVDRFQGNAAVNRPLARAQQIQIGTMKHKNFRHR